MSKITDPVMISVPQNESAKYELEQKFKEQEQKEVPEAVKQNEVYKCENDGFLKKLTEK